MQAELNSPMVRIKRTHGQIVVSFAVLMIDKRNFALIADELDEIVRSPNPQSVTVDLTGVRWVDELGLAMLQSVQESIKDVGGTVTLSGPTDQIEQAVSKTRPARENNDRQASRRPGHWTRW